MRVRTGVVALALAIALAGCGGGGSSSSSSTSSGGDAADLVPPDALAFVTVDTDFGSAQLKSAQAVLDRFPIKDKLLASVRESIARSGVDIDALRGSVGPEVDVAVLRVDGAPTAVGFTRPNDQQTFDRQLGAGKTPVLHEQISGWTVFCDEQAALDAVKHRSGKLSDLQAYKDSTATLPGTGDALARAYVAPAALGAAISSFTQSTSTTAPSGTAAQLQKIKWVAAAATSHDDGVELEFHAKTSSASASAGKGFTTPPADQIPSGALAAAAWSGGGSSSLTSRAAKDALQQANQLLGIDLSGLLKALSGETLLYVRPGVPVPEVTLLASGGDPTQAEATVAQLIRRFARTSAAPTPVTVEGVTLQRVALGSVDLFYGVFDGKLIVSDSRRSVSELKSNGDKLSDDSVFKAAKNAAGMPDSAPGFLYVNLRDAIPAVEGLAALGNQRIPAQVDANLQPLKSLLVYGSASGDVQNVVAFLQTG